MLQQRRGLKEFGGRIVAELTKATKVRADSVLPGPRWTTGIDCYLVGLAKPDRQSSDTIIAENFKGEEPSSIINRFVRPREVASVVIFIFPQNAMNDGACASRGGCP